MAKMLIIKFGDMESSIILLILSSVFMLTSSYIIGSERSLVSQLGKELNSQSKLGEKQQQKHNFLALSAFELFSITDLVMEIGLKPCPIVSRPGMSSIKKFLVAGLTRVPQKKRSSHAEFYTTYHSLVNCLSRTEETFSKVKPQSSPFEHKRKRETETMKKVEDSKESPKTLKDNYLAKHHEYLEKLSIIDPLLSFEEFFTLLLSITDQTCKELEGISLPMEFMIPVLSEALYWAKAQDSSVYKTAQIKYFHDGHIVDELRKCEHTFETVSSNTI